MDIFESYAAYLYSTVPLEGRGLLFVGTTQLLAIIFFLALYPAPSRIPCGLAAEMNGDHTSFPRGLIPRGEGAGFILAQKPSAGCRSARGNFYPAPFLLTGFYKK